MLLLRFILLLVFSIKRLLSVVDVHTVFHFISFSSKFLTVWKICYSRNQISHTVTVGSLLRCSPTHFFLLFVFVSSSPPAVISLLILLLNLFHSQVSDISSWMGKESERGTRYRESAESHSDKTIYTHSHHLSFTSRHHSPWVLNRCACSDQFCLLDDCWV